MFWFTLSRIIQPKRNFASLLKIIILSRTPYNFKKYETVLGKCRSFIQFLMKPYFKWWHWHLLPRHKLLCDLPPCNYLFSSLTCFSVSGIEQVTIFCRQYSLSDLCDFLLVVWKWRIFPHSVSLIKKKKILFIFEESNQISPLEFPSWTSEMGWDPLCTTQPKHTIITSPLSTLCGNYLFRVVYNFY